MNIANRQASQVDSTPRRRLVTAVEDRETAITLGRAA
jgi:hypothetical protein